MCDWKPFDTVPRDNTPVLVYLEKKLLGSRIQVGVFNEKGTDLIGGHFAFDCPKPLVWEELPEPPDFK